MKELLAANLKERRKISGLSQAMLARRVGVSTHHIAMIELARNFPSPELLDRIAAALEMEAPELFSQPPSPSLALRRFQAEVLAELRREVKSSVTTAVDAALGEAVERVICGQAHKLAAGPLPPASTASSTNTACLPDAAAGGRLRRQGP